MIIEINETWRIASDEVQYIVQRFVGTNKPRWKAVAYCTSLPSAVSELLERDLRLVDNEPLAEALEKNKALRTDVDRALQPILNPIQE